MSYELGFHSIMIFTNMRTTQTSSLSRDGGIHIAIRNNINYKLVIIENNNIDILFELVKIYYLNIIFRFVYISNKSNEIVYNN